MQFRIADTFQASLAKLTNQEQKAVKITVFDLQSDPASPGLSFHKLHHSKDPNFWSVRVNRDIRLIVHRTAQSILIAYVDHHDDAYAWAERRRIEVHPRTGAAQLVEVRETVEDIVVQQNAVEAAAEPPLFPGLPDDDTLLSYGIPEAWLTDVREVTESGLFDLLEHLPQEASEALLELATGGTPVIPQVETVDNPFDHPDALRRVRVMDNVDELRLALDYPWEKWSVFLHPAQRQYVERDYNGPVRIGGTAGTGKTVVALHRAVWLANKYLTARILLTTFSQTLAENLKMKLGRLEANPKVLDRINVSTLDQVALDLFSAMGPKESLADQGQLESAIDAAVAATSSSFGSALVREEWSDVVDAWDIRSWNEYQKVPRLGRKTRLGSKQREDLWAVFEEVASILEDRGLLTMRMIQERIVSHMVEQPQGYDFVVVDEAQDIGVAQLRFVQSLITRQHDGLFFAGDLGQRIFQSPFSWKSLGVDIRGRSFTLKINYRTSHQIRSRADRLLPTSVRDIDGNVEERRGVVSVFNGEPPTIRLLDTGDGETEFVGKWLCQMLSNGIEPDELGIIVRSDAELDRAERAVATIDSEATFSGGNDVGVRCIAMHDAKGLEFRAVVVMACDDEIIPDLDRIESVVDEADLEEVYETERHLLYVAFTRARDHLLVTGVSPGSEFLQDM